MDRDQQGRDILNKPETWYRVRNEVPDSQFGIFFHYNILPFMVSCYCFIFQKHLPFSQAVNIEVKYMARKSGILGATGKCLLDLSVVL